LPTFVIESKAKFQLEVSENGVVIFSHPSSWTTWNLSMDCRLWNGLHGPEKQSEAGLMVLSVMDQGKTSLQQNK